MNQENAQQTNRRLVVGTPGPIEPWQPIVGGVIGGVCGLILLILIIWGIVSYWRSRKAANP